MLYNNEYIIFYKSFQINITEKYLKVYSIKIKYGYLYDFEYYDIDIYNKV